MLNLECVDEQEDGKVGIVFTDSEGDECIKITISEKNAIDLARDIQNQFGYAAKKRKNR